MEPLDTWYDSSSMVFGFVSSPHNSAPVLHIPSSVGPGERPITFWIRSRGAYHVAEIFLSSPF